jgi:Na+-translocating ferredoxin:NAD+ oxidoreductase RNF subunit RnfB
LPVSAAINGQARRAARNVLVLGVLGLLAGAWSLFPARRHREQADPLVEPVL